MLARPSKLEVDAASRGLVVMRVSIDPREVVFFKSIVEASEGVASIFADKGGELTLATPSSRVEALRELLADLVPGAYAPAHLTELAASDVPTREAPRGF